MLKSHMWLWVIFLAEGVVPEQWFSKCDLWISSVSINIIWQHVRNANSMLRWAYWTQVSRDWGPAVCSWLSPPDHSCLKTPPGLCDTEPSQTHLLLTPSLLTPWSEHLSSWGSVSSSSASLATFWLASLHALPGMNTWGSKHVLRL